MNKADIVNQGPRLEAQALQILRAVPGLKVIGEPRRAANHKADFIMSFGGTRAHVLVEVKSRANAATAWQLIRYAEALPGTPVLLIASETTREARELLAEHGVAVVDGLGNVHIDLPGLLVHLEGRRPPARRGRDGPPTRLRGKAGVAVQALLLHPEQRWKVEDLAREARISTGLAHRVLTRLGGEGVVAAEGAGPKQVRVVTNPGALLDLWSEENLEQSTRTLAYVLAQTPQQVIAQVGAKLDNAGIDYALTGAAAASLVAPFVTAVPVVDVWVTARAAHEDLCSSVDGEPVTDGENVVFLQAKDDTPLAFREKSEHELWMANRFRLYSDLRRDPRRGRDQADNLRREVIGF